MKRQTFKQFDEMVEETGLKYDAVAEKLGVSRQRLYTMRIDPTSMDVVQMEKLANILGVDFYDIYEMQKNFRNKVDKNATEQKHVS